MQVNLEIKISPDYRALVPRPTPEQYAALKESIRVDGQHMPITVNQDGVVLDGHTRYDICKELGREPIYEIRSFDDLEEEKTFVIMVNLSRRHLTLFQRGEVLLSWFRQERSTRRQRAGHRAWEVRRGLRKKGGTPADLYKRGGKMLGCAHSTFYKMMYILENGDEQIKNKCRNGLMPINSAFEKVSNRRQKSSTEYGKDYLRYPYCLNCKAETVRSETTGCHVHLQLCCTKCRWGI